jgi:Arc/MetJ-type ribon-helix-helix transcriptional regulator
MATDLPKELREFVDSEIRAGRYPSEEHLFADALLQLKERVEMKAWLQARLDEAVASIDRGEARPFDLEDTKRRLIERAKARGIAVDGAA